MARTIFHIASSLDWEAATRTGRYVGDTLRSEGFVHCSTAEQVAAVAERFYRGRQGLILLAIDADRLGAGIRYENLEGGAERFPHVYGPIETAAVIGACAAPPGPDGRLVIPPDFLKKHGSETGPSPDWLDRRAYPFASRYWPVDAGRMHYIDEGQGQPVVFVHGVPTWTFNFRELIKHLSGRYRCVAMDHLGFGLSDKPSDWDYAPRDLARNVASLIDGLALDRITLVVHDWGGPLGLSYALARPEKIDRIILLNTWLWSSSHSLRARVVATLLASPLYRFLEQRFNFTARVFIPQVMGDRSRLTRAVHAHYLAPLRNPEERKGVWALAREILHAGPWLDELWHETDRIADKPALILWGLRDKAFTKADLAKWRERLPKAKVRVLEAAGHFPHEEAPEEVCAAVERFLGGVSGTRHRPDGHTG